ncbi:hypothetical protein D9M71_615770 [compost metagenome]
MLNVAAVALELVGLIGTAAEVRLITQSPGAQVDAVAQAQVVGQRGGGVRTVAVAAQLVIDERRRYAVIPQRRVDIPAHAALHGDLRHAHHQAQPADVIALGGFVDQRGQVVAGLWLSRGELVRGFQLFHVDAQLPEQVQGQAGLDFAGAGCAPEFNITTANQYFVAVKVDPVVTR